MVSEHLELSVIVKVERKAVVNFVSSRPWAVFMEAINYSL